MSRKLTGTAISLISLISLIDCAALNNFSYSSAVASEELTSSVEEVETLFEQGRQAVLEDNFQAAISILEQALGSLGNSANYELEIEILDTLGDAYLGAENYEQSIDAYHKSLSITRSLSDFPISVDTLYGIGVANFELNRYGEAETALLEALDLLEIAPSERLTTQCFNNLNIKFTPRKELEFNVSRLLQIILVEQGRINEALIVAERGRNAEFDRTVLLDFYSDEVRRCFEASPNISEIRQIALRENAVLVYYSSISSEIIYSWVVQPTGEIEFREINTGLSDNAVSFTGSILLEEGDRGEQGTAFAELVREVIPSQSVQLRSQRNRDLEEQRISLQQLYNIIIVPISDLLPSDPETHVIFVPQRSLSLVPFAALKTPSGQHLIEQHTIRIVGNLRSLLRSHSWADEFPNSDEILVVGNPQPSSIQIQSNGVPQELSDLPGAEHEANNIASMFNAPLLTGNAATETETVKRMANARIVHFAAHGILDDILPENVQNSLTTLGRNELITMGIPVPGAIALTPSQEDDGFLTALEIANMQLNADLVVLSACNTGSGQPASSSVVGLPLALAVADVPSVIVTLWTVPDAPTAELMIEFYTHLYEDSLEGREPDLARALRQAMLNILSQEEYRNPRNWAGFTLIGSAG